MKEKSFNYFRFNLIICLYICFSSTAITSQCSIENDDAFLSQVWVQDALNEVSNNYDCESKTYTIITFEQDGVDFISFSCFDETTFLRSYMLYTCDGTYSEITCDCGFAYSCSNGFFEGFCLPEFEGTTIYEGGETISSGGSNCDDWITNKIDAEVTEYCDLVSVCQVKPKDYYYRVFESLDDQIIFEKFSCVSGIIEFYYKNGDLISTCDLAFENDAIKPQCNLSDYPFTINNMTLFSCNFENEIPTPSIDVNTLGMPCDDNNPDTDNDVIQEDCSCKGQIHNSNKLYYNHSISIYPNPMTDLLYIDVDESVEINMITILNTYGQIVYAKAVDKKVLDLTHLSSGVFFMKVETNHGKQLIFELVK